jgi:hypothetical protein
MQPVERGPFDDVHCRDHMQYKGDHDPGACYECMLVRAAWLDSRYPILQDRSFKVWPIRRDAKSF